MHFCCGVDSQLAGNIHFPPFEAFYIVFCILLSFYLWALTQTHRAAIVPIRASFFPNEVIAGQLVVIGILLQNGGDSTAFVTEVKIVYRVSPAPGPSTPDYSTQQYEFQTMIPAHDVYWASHPIIIGTDTAAVIKSGAQKIWVYGDIAYEDFFSWLFGPHRASFCYLYDVNQRPALGSGFNGCDEVP